MKITVPENLSASLDWASAATISYYGIFILFFIDQNLRGNRFDSYSQATQFLSCTTDSGDSNFSVSVKQKLELHQEVFSDVVKYQMYDGEYTIPLLSVLCQ